MQFNKYIPVKPVSREELYRGCIHKASSKQTTNPFDSSFMSGSHSSWSLNSSNLVQKHWGFYLNFLKAGFLAFAKLIQVVTIHYNFYKQKKDIRLMQPYKLTKTTQEHHSNYSSMVQYKPHSFEEEYGYELGEIEVDQFGEGSDHSQLKESFCRLMDQNSLRKERLKLADDIILVYKQDLNNMKILLEQKDQEIGQLKSALREMTPGKRTPIKKKNNNIASITGSRNIFGNAIQNDHQTYPPTFELLSTSLFSEFAQQYQTAFRKFQALLDKEEQSTLQQYSDKTKEYIFDIEAIFQQQPGKINIKPFMTLIEDYQHIIRKYEEYCEGLKKSLAQCMKTIEREAEKRLVVPHLKTIVPPELFGVIVKSIATQFAQLQKQSEKLEKDNSELRQILDALTGWIKTNYYQ